MPPKGRAAVSVANKEKAVEAARLRVAGATWEQISKELGFKTESGARLAVNRHFKREIKEAYESMHPVLQERAEALWRKAWARLNRASDAQFDAAFKNCLSVMTYSARINGLLDRGPQIEINLGESADLQTLRSEFMALSQQGNTIDGETVESASDQPVN